MNEAATRAELIDPQLKRSGWGVTEGSKIHYEYPITSDKILLKGKKPLKADYVLEYKGVKLAVIEAKSDELEVGEGVAQAKLYAKKLHIDMTYASNGKEIYAINMKSGEEKLVSDYPTPQSLWNETFAEANEWRDRFALIPFENKGGNWQLRYYQETAVKNVMEAVANDKKRILLTLATGTGKTAIAFQISWKLYQTRWNLRKDGARRPRILFLADRNILANQAFNDFSSFAEDALVRIKPEEIKKKGSVPMNGSVFFTIFQTFMSGGEIDELENSTPYFGDYPKDYFDFIIIDECHRGGANDESSWRDILEYFSPAVQLGLTATPKRKDNADTYRYFGEPVYVYSLKEGIEDGYLTPFKVKRIKTTLDDYIFTSDDEVIEGEVEEGRLYTEADFNRNIEIREREAKRVEIFMNDIDQSEKTVVFCATQGHAALVRDLINQRKKESNPDYCVRVTADDGEIGENFLRDFQDNEKTIPAILTTSQKLSTGVNARNIRNIILMRPVNSMIEFKQIIGRGTRLFDGKEFFTVYDFVDAYLHFADPEWDGDPIKPENIADRNVDKIPQKREEKDEPREKKIKIKVRLRDGKEREIAHMMSTSFWNADGKPVSAEEFLANLFGELPNLFKSEEELRIIWSNPSTRKALLEKLSEAGFPKNDLLTLQKLVNMEKSDLYDVLEYVFNSDYNAITREDRVKAAGVQICALFGEKQREFISFVLNKYIEIGIEELEQEKLPILLKNKYQSLEDAKDVLGDTVEISKLFVEFQKYLYQRRAA
jgi:type I restriction enzyme R subunit